MFPTEYGSNTLSHVASPFKPHLDPQRRQPDQTLYTIDFSPNSSCTNFSNSADQVSWAGNEPWVPFRGGSSSSDEEGADGDVKCQFSEEGCREMRWFGQTPHGCVIWTTWRLVRCSRSSRDLMMRELEALGA
jgi:hypothetical protein